MNPHENGQDTAWLHAALEQFEHPLIRYATRLVGDVDRGRDVVQDVFMKLCREGPERPTGHLAAWLYTVCRNRAIDVRRKEQQVIPLSPGVAASAAASGPNPADALERQEDASHAQALLKLLPENQQEIIRLKVEHGLKYREISEVTGLSVSNVGYLLHQGLQTLRRQYAEQL